MFFNAKMSITWRNDVQSSYLSLKNHPPVHRRICIWNDAKFCGTPGVHNKNKFHRGFISTRLLSIAKKGHLTLRQPARSLPSSQPPRQAPHSGSRESQERARRTSRRQSTVGARRGTTCVPIQCFHTV